MYLGMDGTGVPMRQSEVAGCVGKQPDGSAKTREAKLVTVWTAESRDDQGKPMRDPGSVTYAAAIESAATRDTNPERSDFAERVLREATRRSFTAAPRCAVLGDGAACPERTRNRGSGTPPRSCFLKPFRYWIGTTLKKPCTAPRSRSLVPPAQKPNPGPRRAVPNWMMEN